MKRCEVCGEYIVNSEDGINLHMTRWHSIAPASIKTVTELIRPIKTTNRTKAEITEALEVRLGKQHFHSPTVILVQTKPIPGVVKTTRGYNPAVIEMSYAKFMANMKVGAL